MKSSNTIIQSWHARADAYHARTKRWDIFQTLAERLLELFPENFEGSVLDLAGGAGLVSALLSKKFPRANAHLLEPAENMMRLARKRLGKRVKKYYALQAEEAHKIPVLFDAVMCNVSMHLMDEKKVFHAVSRVLKPGGMFCFNLWGHSYAPTVKLWIENPEKKFVIRALQKHGETLEDEPKSQPPRKRTLKELREAASRAGLKLSRPVIHADKLPVEFFIDFAAMSGAYPKPLTASKRNHILSDAKKFSRGLLIPVHTVRFKAAVS